MGGSAPKNTTQTTIAQVPAWLTSAYQGYLGQEQAANTTPYTQYNGQLQAGLSSGQQQALGLASQGASGAYGTQGMQSADLAKLLGGQYSTQAGANPYLGKTTNVGVNPYAGPNQYLNGEISQSDSNITNQYKNATAPSLAAQFSQGGAFGGSAYNQQVQNQQNTLAQNLASNENTYRAQDYTAQQGLAKDALNRSVSAQQADLTRNSSLYQQGFENSLAANNQNASQIINANTGLNQLTAQQQAYLQQLAALGSSQQDVTQGNLNQQYYNFQQAHGGYTQNQLNNIGSALGVVSGGGFNGQSSSGTNPAYVPKTAGGALTAAAGGAMAGSSFGPYGTAIGAVVGAGAYYL